MIVAKNEANQLLCDLLRKIAFHEHTVGRTIAALRLRDCAEIISSRQDRVTNGTQMTSYVGIGEWCARYIDMILEGRFSDLVFNINDDYQNCYKELMISEAERDEFIKRGYRNLADLADHSEALSFEQRLCLEKFYQLNSTVSLTKADDVLRSIQETCNAIPDIEFKLFGDYEQQPRTIIDVLVVSEVGFGKGGVKKFNNVIRILESKGIIQHFLQRKADQYFGLVLHSGTLSHLRLHFAQTNQEVCRAMFLSKSEEEFQNLQRLAMKRGMRLGNYFLSKNNENEEDWFQTEYEIVPVSNEGEFFEILGYVPVMTPSEPREN